MSEGIDQEWRNRLEVFYKHYQPEKLNGVEVILRKVNGIQERFDSLLQKLVHKYGPEPEAPPKIKVQAEGTTINQELERRISEFYTFYNESKLDTVRDLVARTKNKFKYEVRLMKMLEKKYGPEPVLKTAKSKQEAFRQRLIRFYTTYQPSKVSTIDALVTKAESEESQEQLFRMLVSKYGPEPCAGSDDDGSDDEQEERTPNRNSLLKVVIYCPVDGMPPEYCEYLPTFDECLPWMLQNCPDLRLSTKDDKTVEEYCLQLENGEELEEKKKKDSRGGKARPNKNINKKTKQGKPLPTKITIERTSRSKRKYITVVIGLDGFDVKLKEAAKKLGKKFACSASVSKLPGGGQSVDIQGDVCYELPDLLVEYFPHINKDKIHVIES